MIESLYDNFKYLSQNGSVWLISDTHFDDSDCKIMNPNWISTQDHINHINSKVFKNDTLICLGDCGDIEYFKKLKAGKKILIKGNHDDRGDSFYKRKVITEKYDKSLYNRKELIQFLQRKYSTCSYKIYEEYSFHSPFELWTVIIDNGLFDEVYSGAVFISDRILLSHEPVYNIPFCINIHGHVHNGEHLYYDESGCKHINIASDVVNWELINLGELIKKGIISDIPTIHRLTIDNAINSKK